MPLDRIDNLSSDDNYIILDGWDDLSKTEIKELEGFINRKIIEYYLNKVNERKIVNVINDVLILKKKVDWSIFNYGITIPQDKHKLIELVNEEKIPRGEARDITVEIDEKSFHTKLRSVDIQDSESDTIQIRYDNNTEIIEYLKEIFNNSWNLLSESKNHKSEEISEYLMLFSTGEPYKYKIISTKEYQTNVQNVWWVNQGETFKEEIKYACIWAPLENKNGSTYFHWENVSKVTSGDLILHNAN